MLSTNDIRSQFLEYFRRHDHEVVPSSPLVPRNDPTLLFTNAGMVQFKNVFTGQEHRPYSRAATSQKCVRAGGKHNDLENVGYTARHHTFFEMLGNFSFGDYFKERAIELAWLLVTQEFGLPKERLLATVYAEDDDAYNLWKKVAGLPDDRIIRIGTSDNFWAMGDTGPCGPCSEIFYDHGPDVPGGPPGSPDEDGDRFIEIWNLVFMQYDQPEPGKKVDLPRPSIDTGMGLERIAAVLQGKHDNYDIDLFRRLMEASGELSGVDPDGDHRASHKVIADHLRATAFLMADGVLPSNEGRGYVLRRIMRRAMRHVHKLGVREPMMWRLVPELVNEMSGHFSELRRAEALITETLKMEEGRFQETLDRGLKLLGDETDRLGKGGTLPGEVAFKLYDTYGFPLDLTRDILRGQDLGLDEQGFEAAMERQRAAARKAWAGSGEAAYEKIWLDLRDRLGATEFLGYENDVADGHVLAIVKDGQEVQEVAAGEQVHVVLNQTPFYGESGGQVGDTGTMTGADATLSVTDTQKKVGDLHVHAAKVESGTLRVGESLHLQIDAERRSRLRAHHSATHLLHEALRRRLGEHVTQKGSLVAPDRLRFDISQPKPLSETDLRDVETAVNARIRGNTEVTTRFMTKDEAIEAGALALFGEKYGEEVRVVSMGGVEEGANKPYSVELCGGTHVRRTGDIGFFKIVREEGLAAGVRRIEAVAHRAAEDFVREEETTLKGAAAALRTTPGELQTRLNQLLDERKRLEKDLAETRKKLATGAGSGAETETRDVGGVNFACRVLADVPPKDLKPMADEMKKRIGSGVVAITTSWDGKASIVVGVTDDLTERVSAVDLVRIGAQALGGKGGGGRADMAQAGGSDPEAGNAAVAAIESALSESAAA
ncbi:alanine--tRNA ligase [Ferruginivarius sediminum]|uniref:Alanine--tRNA ligase n=1 Tax=Ferruginivarius sediminum TaxID=2661937 RepID=A0A369T696_9PROT|nr:alanine--tRNA ligase [Ferruginivarius sediminum]RDD60849.1 alanine--tRNA ligase [Ferruginivarius sediminum]